MERFIRERGIKCHPHYYDDDGNFHVERRVGCIGCPLQSDKGKADFRQYPTLFKACVKAYQRWWNSHPNAKTVKSFPNVYDSLYMKIFCNNMQEYRDAVAPPYSLSIS